MSYRDTELNEFLETGTRCDTIPLHNSPEFERELSEITEDDRKAMDAFVENMTRELGW